MKQWSCNSFHYRYSKRISPDAAVIYGDKNESLINWLPKQLHVSFVGHNRFLRARNHGRKRIRLIVHIMRIRRKTTGLLSRNHLQILHWDCRFQPSVLLDTWREFLHYRNRKESNRSAQDLSRSGMGWQMRVLKSRHWEGRSKYSFFWRTDSFFWRPNSYLDTT